MNDVMFQIKKVKGPIDIKVNVPSSKSILARTLILACLSSGECTLKHAVLSRDTRTLMIALRELGFSIFYSANLKEIRVRGTGGEIPKKEAELNLGNAGTAARFIVAILALSDGTYTINSSLEPGKRSMKELINTLRLMGAGVTYAGVDGRFPIRIVGAGRNSFQKIDISVDISKSTQFASALLMALPLMNTDSRLKLTGVTRTSYIDMTVKLMENFGQKVSKDGFVYSVNGNGSYKPGEYELESDAASACYAYAAAAILGGKAQVRGIHADSFQTDMAFLNLLKDFGALINDAPEGLVVSFKGAVVKDRVLTYDLSEFSDQTATLAIIAAQLPIKLRIENIGNIKQNESNRISVIASNLKKCGINAREGNDFIEIDGGKPHGTLIDPKEDHRIAMAFSVLGLKTGDMSIKDFECVEKTYPDFYEEIIEPLSK